MEASQKRTRAMMNRAAELARVALDLEKELRWAEALKAYYEVCSYFKRILEVADSSDVSDILYVVSLSPLSHSESQYSTTNTPKGWPT